MAMYLRLIPEWRHFASRLKKTIQERERQSQESQADKEETIYQDVHPAVKFHFSCPPSDHLHCITAYTGHSGNTVLGFQWSQTVIKHQINMWQDDGQGSLCHHSTIPVYGKYKIERMLFVPNQRVLVGYCNDMCLRVLTDNTQEMVVLYHTQCPASVLSMHYCPETNQLLTGSMGLIAFWGFWTSAQTPLSLLRILDWTQCSIERETLVSAFVSQRQTNSIYVLCDRNIKNFENTGKHELLEFRGHSIASLQCVVAEWRQRYIYTGDAEGYVQVWSCDMRRLFLQFRAHATAVTSVVLLAESGSILTASMGCWIKQWTRSGDLLLKLHIDMPGGVQTLWKLRKNTIMCQSSTSLDVWRLNSLYRSFNDTACAVRVLKRAQCSHGKGRIIAVTLDGIIRFLSPVTGELLALSWPFLHIDKALSFAYDPSQEELYVCDGSVEVLVLNATLSPCPVKHIVNTVREGNDEVLCLEVVEFWSSKSGAGDDTPLCLVFSGHRNGRLQLLAPLSMFCEPQKAHNGALVQMSSLSGHRPSICCYGSDYQFTVWSVGFERGEVCLTLEAQISCNFTPVHSRLMQGLICAVSPRQHLVFYSIHGGRCVESERKKSERISCLDYCSQLDILALTGESGKIEIWNHKGDMAAEIQIGVAVTQVCFGNARGDILASFADSISIIPVTHFLPASYLRIVLNQAPIDDVVELPIPFLPKSPLHYDMSMIPKIYLKYLKLIRHNVDLSPDQTTTESLSEGSIPTENQEEQTSKSAIKPYNPTMSRKSVFRAGRKIYSPSPKVESDEESEEDIPTEELSLRKRSEEDFLFTFSRIARDGYIPNSVIRAMQEEEEEEEEEKEEEEEEELKKKENKYYFENIMPQSLLKDNTEKEFVSERTQAIQDILTRAKVTRTVNAQQATFTTSLIEEQAEEDGQRPGAMGREEREETEQQTIQAVQSLLGDLNVTCEFAYKECCEKLMGLLGTLQIDPNLLNELKSTFVSHVEDSSLPWRQQEGLRNLHWFQLLDCNDIGQVGSFLIHLNPTMRALARKILKELYQIFDKQALAKELQKTMSLVILKTLLDKLTDNLELIVDVKNIQPSLTTTQGRTMTHQIKSRDTKESKTRDIHYSVKPVDNQRGFKQMSQYKDPQNVRRFSIATQESPEVPDMKKIISDRRSENEFKLTQTVTDTTRTSRTLIHAPKTARQKKRAVQQQSKKDSVHDIARPVASPKDPLLYAFRKARKYKPGGIPPIDLSVPKCESHLLTSDSGLGSLVSQETSSEMVPSGGAGASLPFCYGAQHPDHISQDPHTIHEHHDDDIMTTVQPHHRSKRAQHTKQQQQQVSQHSLQTSQHAPHVSQHSLRTTLCAPHVSQHPQQTIQFFPHISQHSLGTTQHAPHISQNSLQISQHAQQVSQHSLQTTHFCPHISQHSPQVSQHAPHVSQNSLQTTQCAPNTSQHPRHVFKRSQKSTYQHPKQTSQTSRGICPYPAGLVSGTQEKPTELGHILGEGDPHWRESLHKLISLHGFRSKKAAKQAASLCAQPLRLQTCVGTATRTLPRLRSRSHWQGAMGERVAQNMEMTGACEETSPTRFQHKLPLPWRLGHIPLSPHGQVKYGKLEVDWVRSDDSVVCQRGKISLPKINPKGAHIQA